MKNKTIGLVAGFLLVSCLFGCASNIDTQPQTTAVSTPFSKGVNFTEWFAYPQNAQSIPFARYNEQDFENAKNMGIDVIRLPIVFHNMTSGSPDYTIDPILFMLLDRAVDWAEKYQIYIILDWHGYEAIPVPNDAEKFFIPVWEQVAGHFRNRSDYVIYEILNEPNGISDRRWGEIQGMTIDAIRRIDQSKWIVVGGADWNNVEKLFALPRYSDQKLIYTFHFYDPFLFTHQGQAQGHWDEEAKTMGLVTGIPFPYDRSRMPSMPSALRGWVRDSFINYSSVGGYNTLNRIFNRAVAFSRQRNVPVFAGEFAVAIHGPHNEDRVRWYEFVSNSLDIRNISRASWDYLYGEFGIATHYTYDGRSGIANNFDINVDIVRAMGFTPPPPASSRSLGSTIKSGFTVYDDFLNPELNVYTWGNVDFSLYDTNTADGDFVIRLANAEQGVFSVYFNGRDFSELASGGYILEFKARTDRPVRINVEFWRKESQTSIPWRVSYTIDERIFTPNGRWQTLRIPLRNFREQGAWIDAAQQNIAPRGEFTWDNIERLVFGGSMEGRGYTIYFDDIKVVAP